ncbi:MAG: outer membrane protein assembly factor, partial [Odoribacter splanchnicus]|nr:outer membrane protein assembly factor [Odoribacter splanchnicus]
MKENTSYKILLVFWVLILCWSCSSTKYVGKDEYLLNRVKLEVKDKKMSTGELKKTIRQKPNTRILGVFRFHLGLYNLSGRNEEKRFNRWLRSIGEAPVIYSPFMTDRSKSQLELYLDNKGYYNATVQDSVTFRKKKAHVKYYIDPGEVIRVEDYSFRDKHGYVSNELPDTTEMMQMMLADTTQTLLRRGMPMDIEILESERERITKMLRENGYFNFSKNFIQYYADTTRKSGSELVHLLLSIADKQPDSTAYQKYAIGKIQVNLDYNPLLMMSEGDTAYVRTKYGDCDVIYSGKLKIRPGVILESIQ